MQLSFYHVTLALVAVLAVICKVYGSEDSSHLQDEMRKRIFCNFYGCGSKRSGVSGPGADDLSRLDDSFEAPDSAQDVPFSALADNEVAGSSDDALAAREAALIASRKILRVAAMWEALKARLRRQRPHAGFSPNSS